MARVLRGKKNMAESSLDLQRGTFLRECACERLQSRFRSCKIFYIIIFLYLYTYIITIESEKGGSRRNPLDPKGNNP